MRKQEVQQCIARFLNSEFKSPRGTANKMTAKKKFERNRSSLVHDTQNKGTFRGNLRRTYNI